MSRNNSADILASGCGVGGLWRVTDRQVVLVPTATSSLAPTGAPLGRPAARTRMTRDFVPSSGGCLLGQPSGWPPKGELRSYVRRNSTLELGDFPTQPRSRRIARLGASSPAIARL